MNHMKILKRAFDITLNYKVLWIFGILLALTTGGGGNGGGNGGGGNGGGSSSGNGSLPGFNGQDPFGTFPEITPALTGTLVAIGIGVFCLVLALIVIGSLVRYVSETAVIRMVDQYENNGEKLSFRQGWRLGWTRSAWNLFLMDFLVGLLFAAILIALLAVAAIPLLTLAIPEALPLHILGGVISAGLFLLIIFAAILAGLAVTLVMLFARRSLVLENLGIQASIKRAISLIRGRLGDTILMGVMMVGVGIAYALVTIPIILALVVVAALAGGLPGLLVGSITAIFADGALPWIVGGLVGLPIFVLVLAAPASLIRGWMEIYSSSAWTLTFRELTALEKVGVLPTPAGETPAAIEPAAES